MDAFRRVFVRRYLIQVILIHIVVLSLGGTLFTWGAFYFSLFLFAFFGGAMGIFHHMLLSHRSFKTHKGYDKFGALLGTLTWRGPFAGPIRYVALHRVHHRYADTEYDPHSPIHGLFHSWMGWFWNMPLAFTDYHLYEKYAGRMAQDPFFRFLDRHVDFVQFVWGLVCFLGGGLWPLLWGEPFDVVAGMRFLVYGVFVKSLLVIYLANAVDVINHFLGYRNYETRDRSTNSLLMAFIHLGGAVSWHNNHHAHPRYFSVRKRWWELDIYYLHLRFLQLFGFVSDIKVKDEVRSATVKNLQDFMQPSWFGTVRMISQALALWVIPATISAMVWQLEALPLFFKIFISVPLTVVAAHGIHSVGLIGHEGTHFTLHRNRLLSSRLGVLVSSLVPLHFDMGFAVLHADHHRWANTERDPDARFFSRFRSFWSRLFLARLATGHRYSLMTWRLAFGESALEKSTRDLQLGSGSLAIGLSRENIVNLARLNLIAQFLCFGIYIFLTVHFPSLMLWLLWLPTLVAILVSGLRPYVEHASTSSARNDCARSWISPGFDFLYGGINYHLAHHLYPNVPGYRMREFHKWLVANDKISSEDMTQANSLSEFLAAASAPMELVGGPE